MSYDAISASIAPSSGARIWNPAGLLHRIESAYCAYQATHYEQTGRTLPGIIRDIEAANRINNPIHPAACEARALAYDTATALLSRVGEHTLAWTAADRALAAAEQSGKPLLTAFGSYRLAYVLANRKHPQRAIELAATAANALELTMKTPTQEQISVLGGLHLAAASAAAANYDTALTPSFLREARAAADRLGRDANLMRTGFGPVNVAIHTMAASIRLGDSRTAITIGETLDARSLPAALVGRRTQIHLDLAHAYAMRRQDAASVNMLLEAERIRPQLVQFDERTREVITALLSREHRVSTPELRPLARRAGVV